MFKLRSGTLSNFHEWQLKIRGLHDEVRVISIMFFCPMTFYGSFCRENLISQPIEGNNPILRATLVVKLQYLPYFPINFFQTDYTGVSGTERGYQKREFHIKPIHMAWYEYECKKSSWERIPNRFYSKCVNITAQSAVSTITITITDRSDKIQKFQNKCS